jgi:acyl-[acyl-carrier-protein]-phospholipid O-acyltransferase/long-chain-fatty-acid--[acyl-carrier-protein] ligase
MAKAVSIMISCIFRWLLHLFYGFRTYGDAVLQTQGPVLLIPNHVSWFDWLLLVVCLDRDWRFVVSSVSAETSWIHRKIMINRRTFPIDTASPYAVKRMAEYLQSNGRLVLFAEGRLSRTGGVMKLFEGTGFLLHKTAAKVITCYIRGAQRLPYSPNQEQKQWFPRVSLHFGPVLHPPKLENLTAAQSRLRLTNWLRDKIVLQQFETEMEFGPDTIPEAILAAAQRRPRHEVLEDVHQSLTYRRLLVSARLLGGEFERILRREQPRVGVLLPNVNATPVTLLALWSLGKVPAIINYSVGQATMLACAQLAGLQQIITSKTFLEKAKLNVDLMRGDGIEFLFLEDVRARLTGTKKFLGALSGRLASRSLLRRKASTQDPAVILFTSGSEGLPKGVELSHRNLLANIRQMLAVCDLQDWDRFFTALPLFHSFGLSVGTLLPLIRGSRVALYPSPLHYRVVPTAFYHRDCTIMLGTNTFLNGYARKAHVQDFRSLRYMFAGAEKLQEVTANVWAQRFGVRVLEGYGATECSPCLSVNTPLAPKYGSAGKFLPGIEYRLEPVEGVAEGGRLFVRGPNVMRGYLNVDADAKFKALGGWYDTGDVVRVDEEGFLFIQGRLKRFAKVSGEMVSLTAVEEALGGAFPQYGVRCQIAITSRPDPDRGEALMAVTNERKLQIEEIRSVLRAKGFPNICVPREVKFIREIPKLGTGKVNHRELEKLL